MAANRRICADLQWSILGTDGTNVFIEIQQPPSGLHVKGLPPFFCIETAQFATSVTRVGALLTCVFNPTIPADFRINYQPLSTHTRTDTGAFLAGGTQHFVPSGGNPPVTWGLTSNSQSVNRDLMVVLANAAITLTLPLPSGTGETYLILCDDAAGTVATVEDFAHSTVQFVGPGELWSVIWTGSAWAATLVTTLTLALPPYAVVSVDTTPSATLTILTGGIDRVITLPVPASLGETWVVCSDGNSTQTATVNDASNVLVNTVTRGQVIAFVWDGANWQVTVLSDLPVLPAVYALTNSAVTVSATCTVVFTGTTVVITLPVPSAAGETWLIGADGSTPNTATIRDHGGSAVASAARGQLYACAWSGSAWVATLILSEQPVIGTFATTATSQVVGSTITQVTGGGSVSLQLPSPLATGESFLVSVNTGSGTTAHVQDSTFAPVEDVGAGEAWVIVWSGSAWVATQLLP